MVSKFGTKKVVMKAPTKDSIVEEYEEFKKIQPGPGIKAYLNKKMTSTGT